MRWHRSCAHQGNCWSGRQGNMSGNFGSQFQMRYSGNELFLLAFSPWFLCCFVTHRFQSEGLLGGPIVTKSRQRDAYYDDRFQLKQASVPLQ